MLILLTGATGFLGSHLLKELLEQKYQVVVLKRSFSDISRIAPVLDFCHSYNVNEIALRDIFDREKIDVVIHCATTYSRNQDSVERIIEGNLLFPLQLLDEAIRHQCKYYINTDTFSCKQLPERLLRLQPLYHPEYTLSKYQFRQWGRMRAAESKITFINLQMEHIYGTNDNPHKFIPSIERKLLAGEDHIDLTDGIQIRDFIPVKDAVDAYLKVLKTLPKLSGYYSHEVGTGIPCTLRQFLEQMKQDLQSNTKLNFGALPRPSTEIMYSTASPYQENHNGV